MASSVKRILIVEDDKMFQKILKKRMEGQGYEVIITKDGLERLAAAQREKPDLILLDLLLPRMDGHKVCRLLKHDHQLKDVPVAIFTSRDMDEDAELAKQSGADAFIIKKTRSEVMLGVIEKLLDKNNNL